MKSKSAERKYVLFIAMSLIVFFFTNTLKAADANVAEVPVLVNYVDYNDVGSVPQGTKDRVKDAIKKANEILGKFGISLDHTDSNAITTPSGDGNADLNDRGRMRASGANELDRRYGDCNGMKINIVNDIVEGVAETWRGVAVNNSKVIIIDINQMDVNGIPDINGFGRTIAHETVHDIGDMNDTYEPNDVNKLNYGYTGGGTDLDPNDANEFRRRARERGRTVVAHYIAPGGPAGITSAQSSYIADARGAIHDNLGDTFSYSPGFDPNNMLFKYTDIRFVKFFCADPGLWSSTTRVSLYLDGPFPEHSFFGSYRIWLTQPPSPTPTAGVIFHINRSGPEIFSMVEYLDLKGGQSQMFGPAVVKNNYEMVENPYIRIPVSATVAFDNFPTELISPNLSLSEPVRIYALTEMTDSLLGDYIYDETDTFEFGLTLRENEPVIYLINPGQGAAGLTYGIAGSGFTGIPEVEIKLDDEPVGYSQVKPDGTFRFFTDDPAFEFTPGRHKIVVCPTPGTVQPGRGTWAVLRINFPEVEGDLNSDGNVDFFDFAILAQDWLR